MAHQLHYQDGGIGISRYQRFDSPQIPAYNAEVKIRKTGVYKKWFNKLRDLRAQAIIVARLDRLEDGNRGDWGPIGEGLFEMRIHYGPGYRIYGKDTGKEIIILLCGGDKSTQQADIEKAKQIALEPIEEEQDDR